MTAAATYPLVWDLDSLLPHPERDDFNLTLTSFREDLNALADASDDLPAIESANTSAWVDFLDNLGDVEARAHDLESHIGCHAAAEAENKLFQKLEGQIAALEPALTKVRANVEFAIMAVSEEELEAFIAGSPQLQEIAFYLRDRRDNARFRLPKEQELLAADLGVDGIHGWGRFYDRISGGLKVEVMEQGELVKKSPSQVQFDMPERPVRQNNFYAADKAWATLADDCADALNHISGTRLTLYKRLGLTDHLDSPLRYNRMSRETLTTMWETITNRKSFMLEYFNARAKLEGVDKLAWYDLTAPVTSRERKRSVLTYDTACETIIDTFNGFSSELGDFAKMALSEGWIEAENRGGKRQGGFCTGFPTKQQSRIFMTYTDSRDSMSTLAHELGHAYHSFVLKEKPFFLRAYPMNLAETASTFAEAVLGEQQLANSDSADEQLQILDGMLGDSVAFLMNIHARFIFEDNFHRERPDGELDAARFSELMLAAQKEAYLDGLADDGWNPNFWISKLHFYISGWPFYNFPYTFGYLLSLGLYSVADEFGDEFPTRYRDFLLATGSFNTEEAVQSTLGYDLTRPDFWNKSLDVVERRVKQFVEIAGEL